MTAGCGSGLRPIYSSPSLLTAGSLRRAVHSSMTNTNNTPAYDRLGVRAQILVDRQPTAERCARAASLAAYMLDARNGALVVEALDDRAATLE